MSFTPRHPTEIRLAVESAFDDSNLIDYSCAEIERLERELAEKNNSLSDARTERDQALDAAIRLADMSAQDIKLMAGEMTAGELRCVRAVVKGIVARISALREATK